MLDSLSSLAFATLSSARSEVSLFQRFGAERPESADRTKWHLLLPLDQMESMEVPNFRSDNGSLSVEWVAEDRTYSLERLQSIEASTLALFRAQEAKGAKAKGLPVSYMHAIELRLQGGPVEETLERAGTIFGVHVTDGSDGFPAGLYACIEWTPKAWSQIEDGSWHDLSIALARDYRLADGSTVLGECMFAAALVDVGFFEAIPSARDGLPLDAFSAPAEETIATYRRGLARRLHAREQMNVTLRMDEGMLEQVKAMIDEGLAKHVETLHAMHEKLCALDESLCSMRDAIAVDAATEEEEEEEEESAPDLANSTATTTMSAAPVDQAEAIATRIASKVAPLGEAKIAEQVQSVVESGRLLPSNVRAYALALAKGKVAEADALLGDFTGLASRSGSSHASSVRTAAAAPSVVSADQIVAELVSEGRLRKGTKEFVSEMYSRINNAREAGRLR
jgi:phage I-like protein